MAIISNLTVDQGSGFNITVTVTDTNDDIVDISGFTAEGKIKKGYSSTSSISFDLSENPITNSNGIIALSLSDTTTKNMKAGRYVYDVEITSPAGVTTRILEGQLEVNPGVTLGGQ